MGNRTLLVVGAAGDVGQGIVRTAHSLGWTVIAAGRNSAKLNSLFDPPIHVCMGDISTEAGAQVLWDAAIALAGPIDSVAISVNAPNRLETLGKWTSTELAALLDANLLSHFNAVKVMQPRLPEDGILVGIGGGTADFVIPKMAPVSIAQAGLRMMYRGFARERDGGGDIRQLMIVSMVNGASKRGAARPEWITDEEVGQHLCAILAAPADFPGPILELKSREQIGRPDVPTQQDKTK